MKKYLILTLVFALMMLTPSVGAQDDEELSIGDFALVIYVSSSFNRLQEMSSIIVENSVTMQAEFDSGEQRISQSSAGEETGQMLLEDARLVALQMTGTQDNEIIVDPGLDITNSMSVEFRFVDGVSYLRVYDAHPLVAAFYPDGWFTLNEDDVYFSGLEPMSSEQFTMLTSLGGFGNYYTEYTVTSIEELPEETLEDGRTTRVFDVEVDAEQAFFGIEEYLRAFLGLSTYSIGSYRFKYDILPDMTFDAKIWVDTATEVVAQVEIELAIDTASVASSTDFQMTLSIFNVYTQFNEDFEITAPEIDE